MSSQEPSVLQGRRLHDRCTELSFTGANESKQVLDIIDDRHLRDVDQTRFRAIPINLRANWVPITITCTTIIMTGCVLPITGYLIYNTNRDKLELVYTFLCSFIALITILSFIMRTYALLRPSSTCRPIGSPGWGMDFFNWCFMVIFAIVASVTVYAEVAEVAESYRINAISLALIITLVGSFLIIGGITTQRRVGWPWRISSVARGEPPRTGCLCIMEDVCAVDGKMGQEIRLILIRRWNSSAEFRRLMVTLDYSWGVGALAFVVVDIATVFNIESETFAFVFGWGAPWAWAALWAGMTWMLVKRALRLEKEAMESTTPIV